jgi:hypothetical protein
LYHDARIHESQSNISDYNVCRIFIKFSGEFLQNIVGKRELRKRRLSNSHNLLISVKDLLYNFQHFLSVWIPFGTEDLSVMFLRNCECQGSWLSQDNTLLRDVQGILSYFLNFLI